MEMERILVAVLLVGGFIWLRSRIRALEEGARARALYGSFLLLAVGLVGGKWIFERLPLGNLGNLLVELGGLVALFVVTAAVFTPFGREPADDSPSSGSFTP